MKRKIALSLALILILLISIGCNNPVTEPTVSTSKDITSFTLTNGTDVFAGTITGNEIAVVLPYDEDPDGLVASFVTTGAKVTVNGVEQESGVTMNDFYDIVTYVVTAEDGSTKDYLVTVTHAVPSSDNEITAFGFEGLSPVVEGIIDGQTIRLIVPDGTDVTALVATFSTTGNSVSIDNAVQSSGTTANDFSPRMTYTVTAEDGSIRDYEVLVYYPPIDITVLKQKISNGDDLTNVNTSEITDMSRLFDEKTTFNQDISKWDVSNVSNMTSMFHEAKAFNQDISQWNVSNVKNMYGMFTIANAFNQDISNWDVSNVTNMDGMFRRCLSFNQDISRWDVGNVTNMQSMFSDTDVFDQDLSEWSEHVAESILHSSFSGLDCPLTTAHHPYASWND